MKPKSTLRSFLFLAGSSLLAISSASADQTWDGTGGDDFWNTAANWGLDVLPDFANAITFSGITRATNVNDLTADTIIGGFNFTNTTAGQSFSISGNSITLGGGIITTASSGLGITDTVSLAMILNGNRTITTDTLHDLTLSGIISEDVAGRTLTKSGAGTLNLTAPSSYSGTTTITAGTLALSGGTNRLLNTGTVAFTGASTLDIGSTSQMLAAVTVPDATGFTSTINGSGGTLTINGGTLQWGPGGAIVNGTSTVVNLNGLSNFVFDSSANTFRVGYKSGATNATGSTASSTVTLAASNTITAATLAVGDQTASNHGGTSTLRLGAANVLNVANINIGFGSRSNATLNFNAASSAVTIRNTDGSSAVSTWNIGSINNPTVGGTFTDTVNLSNGTIDAVVTSMTIGRANPSGANRAGTTHASFTMAGGTLTVDTMNLGQFSGNSGTTVNGTMAANGTFTLNSASGTVNATTLTLATNTALTTGGTKSVNGTFNLTNGTLNATTVQRGSQSGTATATLAFNWGTGTIGNLTGTNLTWNDIPITLSAGTHTFDISGSNTATLNSASVINGATFGITKIGTGTLNLNAANTYTGGTTVSDGTLTINGSLADATMAVNGGIVNGTGILTTNINGLAFDAITMTAGTLTATNLTINVNQTGAGLTETEYVLVDATGGGTISGTFAGLTGAPGYELNYGTPNQVKLVQTGGGPTYASWSGGAAANVDSNNDGVDNGAAWALGAADPSANAIDLLPTLDNTSDPTYVIFTFNRSDDAQADSTTTITAEYGNDLVGWTTAVDDNDNVEIEVTDSSPKDTVVVKLKRATLGSSGKLFARLNVVITP
jgi:fibronectin-binding autotransporter adhesin